MSGEPERLPPMEPWHQLSLRHRLALLPREARLMLVGVGLFSLGNGLTLPYLFVYLHDVRHISTATVGMVIAWIAALGLVSAPLWGVMIDRTGPKSALSAALLVEVLGVGSLVWVTDVRQAMVSATLVALGAGGVWPAQNALLARLVPAEERTWLFGITFMMLNLGIGIGGLAAASLVDIGRPGTFQALYALDAIGYLIYVVVVSSLPRGTGREAVAAQPAGPDRLEPAADDTAGGRDEVTSGGYRQVLGDRPFRQLVATAILLILFGYAQLQVGFTAYVTQIADMPARWLGVAFAANTGAILAAQLVVIRRLEGRSRSRALGLVGVLWGSSWAILLLVSAASSLPLAVGALVVAVMVFAVGETVWSPTYPALVNDLAPDRLRGRYNALSGAAWHAGNVLGPIYAGLLIGGGSGQAWPLVTCGGCLLAGGLALRLHARLTPQQDGRAAADATMPE